MPLFESGTTRSTSNSLARDPGGTRAMMMPRFAEQERRTWLDTFGWPAAYCRHYLIAGGAPPPPARVGPHPHAKSRPPARRSFQWQVGS